MGSTSGEGSPSLSLGPPRLLQADAVSPAGPVPIRRELGVRVRVLRRSVDTLEVDKRPRAFAARDEVDRHLIERAPQRIVHRRHGDAELLQSRDLVVHREQQGVAVAVAQIARHRFRTQFVTGLYRTHSAIPGQMTRRDRRHRASRWTFGDHATATGSTSRAVQGRTQQVRDNIAGPPCAAASNVVASRPRATTRPGSEASLSRTPTGTPTHSRFPGAVCRQRWTVRLGEVEPVFGQTGRVVLDITARTAHDGALKWTRAPSTPRAARSIFATFPSTCALPSGGRWSLRRVLQRPGRQRKRSSAKSSCGPSRTSSSAPSSPPCCNARCAPPRLATRRAPSCATCPGGCGATAWRPSTFAPPGARRCRSRRRTTARNTPVGRSGGRDSTP